jgi:hypothetical protein
MLLQIGGFAIDVFEVGEHDRLCIGHRGKGAVMVKPESCSLESAFDLRPLRYRDTLYVCGFLKLAMLTSS